MTTKEFDRISLELHIARKIKWAELYHGQKKINQLKLIQFRLNKTLFAFDTFENELAKLCKLDPAFANEVKTEIKSHLDYTVPDKKLMRRKRQSFLKGW